MIIKVQYFFFVFAVERGLGDELITDTPTVSKKTLQQKTFFNFLSTVLL